jgi:hypothetical protein
MSTVSRSDISTFKIVYRKASIDDQQTYVTIRRELYQAMEDAREELSALGFDVHLTSTDFAEGAPAPAAAFELISKIKLDPNSIASYITIGYFAYKALRLIVNKMKKVKQKEKPVLSANVIASVNLYKFFRHRHHPERYELIHFGLINPYEKGTWYEQDPWYKENHVYGMLIMKSKRRRCWHLVINAYGDVMGVARFKMPMTYKERLYLKYTTKA